MQAVDPHLLGVLRQALDKLDLAVSEQQQSLLIAYVQLVHKWNKAYNLTSVREPENMVTKHIVDSVVVAPLLIGERFIDVGTGPGLPASHWQSCCRKNTLCCSTVWASACAS